MDLPRRESWWIEMSADGGIEGPPTADWTVAAVAHAAVCLTVGLGLAGGIGLAIGPAVALTIYVVYRARSSFVALHALQSLAYQIAGGVSLSLFSVIGGCAVVAAWGLARLSADAPASTNLRVPALMLTLVVAGVLSSVLLSWVAYGLYAAYQVYQGRDFCYWLIGDWVARRRERDEQS